jgi:hypothetical protein
MPPANTQTLHDGILDAADVLCDIAEARDGRGLVEGEIERAERSVEPAQHVAAAVGMAAPGTADIAGTSPNPVSQPGVGIRSSVSASRAKPNQGDSTGRMPPLVRRVLRR